MQPGVVYTTFHHPGSGANVVTTDNSDWATNCPEYKVTAVQVRRTNHYSDWQERDREEDVSLRRIWERCARCRGMRRPIAASHRAARHRLRVDGDELAHARVRRSARSRTEIPVEIVFGGAPFAVMMATPARPRRFRLRLRADRRASIARADEIRAVEVELAAPRASRVDVALTPGRMRAHLARRRALAGPHRLRRLRRRGPRSNCRRRAARRPRPPSAPRRSARRSPALDRQPLNALTRAVHAAACCAPRRRHPASRARTSAATTRSTS